MYYISNNKADLEAYNQRVEQSEGYDGTFTTDWANIIEHQNSELFAIIKHDKLEDVGFGDQLMEIQ